MWAAAVEPAAGSRGGAEPPCHEEEEPVKQAGVELRPRMLSAARCASRAARSAGAMFTMPPPITAWLHRQARRQTRPLGPDEHPSLPSSAQRFISGWRVT